MSAFRVLFGAALVVACHHGRKETSGAPRVVAETTRVAITVAPEVLAAFKDTSTSPFAPAGAREYDLRKPAQRDSLRAKLARERSKWHAVRPAAYQLLVRSACFCPGQHGWLLIESRNGTPSRAWDHTGAVVPLREWSVVDVDQLFDGLQRSVESNSLILIAFDSQWHFPAYVRSSMPPYPDTWSILEARGFRPR